MPSPKRGHARFAYEVYDQTKVLLETDKALAIRYVKEIVKKLKSHDLPKKAMLIQQRLGKEVPTYNHILPHVAAAHRVQEQTKARLAPGTEIGYIIIQGEGEINERARLYNETKRRDYDADYYLWHHLIPMLKPLIKDIDAQIEGEHQTTLPKTA